MNYEKGLGSDVAAVQQVDASTSFYYHDNSNNTCLDECNNESNDELPLRSHYVCYTPESILENKKIQDAVQIGGFCNIMGIKDDQVENGKMIMIWNVIYQKNKKNF